MKNIVLLAAFAAATAVWAQEPAKEGAKLAAKPAAEQPAPPAAQEPAKPEARKAAKPAPMAKKSRRHQDARHCLEKGSNTEIIKCAEAYL